MDCGGRNTLFDMKMPIECYKCKHVTEPEEIEINELTVQSKSEDEMIVTDKQRVCPHCNQEWNSIHIFYSKAQSPEIAYGDE